VSVTDLAYALAAHARGFAVVPPLENGTKRPAGTWKAYQDNRPDEDQIHRWYERGRNGFGVLCGAASDHLEMFELEGRAADKWPEFCRACRDAGLGDLLDRIAKGYAESTPSDGIHLLYRCPDGVEGNLKLARRPATLEELEQDPTDKIKVLMETRGEGGYTILAPSHGPVHPSGKAWQLKAGGLDTVAVITAEERAAFLAVARTFDEMPVAEVPPLFTPPPSPTITAEQLLNGRVGGWFDRTVDAYNRSTTWDQILAGWTRMGTDGNGITYWCRPGKNPRDGHSATTNALGTDTLIVFSSSVEGFESYTGNGPAPSYDRFSAHAVLTGEERVEVGRTLRDQGYGPPPNAPASDPPSEPIAQPASRVDWHTVFDRDLGGDWLLEPLLARGRGHALYASQKAGKSLLAASILVPAAMGLASLDRPAGTPLRTLYLDFEMTHEDIAERVESMGFNETNADELEPLNYHVLPSLPPLDTYDGGQMVKEWALAHRADLVVVDTLARGVAGKENDADTYRAYYRHTGAVLKAEGIATLRLDHTGKDADKGQRGSSAKADDVDVVWKLTAREANVFSLEATHKRMAWVPQRRDFLRHDEPLHYTQVSDSWPAGTKEAAEHLDQLGADEDISIRAALTLLRDAGKPRRQDVVRAAVKYRRNLGHAAGHAFIHRHGHTTGTHPEETPSDLHGTQDGTRPDTEPPSTGHRVPLRSRAPVSQTEPDPQPKKFPFDVETEF
jgi:hypothetical protein